MDRGTMAMSVDGQKFLATGALLFMLVVILLVLTPNQTLTTREIEGGLLGLFSALLIESVWTK